MKNPFKKAGTAARIAQQITEFENQQSELQKKRQIVENLLDGHRGEMRRFVRENPAGDPPAELRYNVTVARDHLESIDEALAECDEQLTDLRQAKIAEDERHQRDGAAVLLEAAAKEADIAGAELKAAAAAIGKALAKLEKALPDGVQFFELQNATAMSAGSRPRERSEWGPVSPREILSMCLAEALAHESPACFDVVYGYTSALHRFFNLAASPSHRTNTLPAAAVNGAEAVRQVVSDRMRTRASEIREYGFEKPVAAPPLAPSAYDILEGQNADFATE